LSCNAVPFFKAKGGGVLGASAGEGGSLKLVGYRCDIDEAKRVVTEAETGICEQEIRMDDMDTNGVNVDSPMFAKINVGVGGGVKFAKTDSGVKISGKSRSKVLEVSEQAF